MRLHFWLRFGGAVLGLVAGAAVGLAAGAAMGGGAGSVVPVFGNAAGAIADARKDQTVIKVKLLGNTVRLILDSAVEIVARRASVLKFHEIFLIFS